MKVSEIMRAIDKSLTRNLNFYAVRYPSEKDIIFNCSTRLLPGIADTDGFIIAPFDNNPENIYTIPADSETTRSLISESSRDYSEANSPNIEISHPKNKKYKTLNNPSRIYPVPQSSTTRDEHSFEVENITARLKQTTNPGKTVAARCLIQESYITPSQLFSELCGLYPDAHIFCFHTQHSGTWIGASPEILLTISDNTLTTMSLAGTRTANSNGEWDAKNIEEQAIVTRYIADSLIHLGLSPDLDGPTTKIAGPVEHLHTIITAKLPPDNTISHLLNQICRQLSPTPALCGYPKDKAIKDIERLEHFKRGYYGGYAGYMKKSGEARIFVNLRSCMFETPCRYILFAGGGIMADSLPESEWEETEKKLSTLLIPLTKDSAFYS